MNNKKQIIFATLLGVTSFLAPTSEAAVTVTFNQVGNNVVATWNGSLDLGGVRTYPWAIGAAGRVSTREMISGFNGAVDIWTGGSAQATTLTFSFLSSRTPATAEWGFSEADFILGEGMKADGLTMIDFGTQSDYTLTWNDATLASIGAASFNNTLAWSSAAGDSISYTTVPEPAALLLCVMGSIGIVIRRRRS